MVIWITVTITISIVAVLQFGNCVVAVVITRTGGMDQVVRMCVCMQLGVNVNLS